MKHYLTRSNFIAAARMLLAIIFLYAALSKGSDFGQFTLQMSQSPLLEPFNTTIVGIGVLAAEIIAALLLSFHKTLKAGFYLSFFIMLMFSAYLSVLYFGYSNIPCACGGILGTMPYPVHIAFNIAFTGMALAGILMLPKEPVAAVSRTAH